ncbi:MAG: hypothetical protein ACI9IL_000724 [Rickettsiales bacterium]|jgi:hypothetical protein
MINNDKEFKHLTFKDRQVIHHMRFVKNVSLHKIADFINSQNKENRMLYFTLSTECR